jgi:Zn-dependent protease with chaperone function
MPAPHGSRHRTVLNTRRICVALSLLAYWGSAASTYAAVTTPFTIESRNTISDLAAQTYTASELTLRLSLANIDRWDDAEVTAALRSAAKILAQCQIRITGADLLRITVPEPHRFFETPRSRELARALALPKPTLFFTAGTRQVPAFDAEAIGRGNSRSRPELTDTVWIARGARDLDLVIAHELAHVLMDSGAHDNTPGNLMAEHTSPQNTHLNAAQCAQMRNTGTRNGLLRPGVD